MSIAGFFVSNKFLVFWKICSENFYYIEFSPNFCVYWGKFGEDKCSSSQMDLSLLSPTSFGILFDWLHDRLLAWTPSAGMSAQVRALRLSTWLS